MRPICRCACGEPLQMRHVRRRGQQGAGGPWSIWYLGFRCPRCGKPQMRRFEVRDDAVSAPSSEVYERAHLSEMGPIGAAESSLALADLNRFIEQSRQ